MSIVIYKVSRADCAYSVRFDAVKSQVTALCPYPILSIDYSNIDLLKNRDIVIDGYNVTVPELSHYINYFPVFYIYDGNTLIKQFSFKLQKSKGIQPFIDIVNSSVNEYMGNKEQ